MLRDSSSAFAGATLTGSRLSAGRYNVTLEAPGAFAGRDADEFPFQIMMGVDGISDECVFGNVSIPDDDTLNLALFCTDVENNGTNVGTPEDRPISFLIFDTAAQYQPDLRIGKRRNPARQKGNSRYNGSGAGQKIRVPLRGKRKSRWFFTVENDGNLVDNIGLRGQRSGGKIRTRFFRLIGGRQNVTGALVRGKLVAAGLGPGQQVTFLAKARLRNPDKRSRKTLRTLARSGFAPGRADVTKAKLIAR